MSRSSRSYPRRWALNFHHDIPPYSFTYPVITLDDLDVTPEEAQLVYTTQIDKRSTWGLWNIRSNISSTLVIGGIEVTPEEADRIEGGEDPVEVLLNARKYRLVAVPWRSKERGED